MNAVIWPPRLRVPSYVFDIVGFSFTGIRHGVSCIVIDLCIFSITYKIKVDFSVYQKHKPVKSMETEKKLIRPVGIPRSDNNKNRSVLRQFEYKNILMADF